MDELTRRVARALCRLYPSPELGCPDECGSRWCHRMGDLAEVAVAEVRAYDRLLEGLVADMPGAGMYYGMERCE